LEYGPQLERIRSKLELVRIRGLAPKEHPDLKLEPPLTEQTVRVFEEEHCVALPEAYRAFITEIGSSGAGPYYGILPLSNWGAANDFSDEQPSNYLARPSPLVPLANFQSGYVPGITENLEQVGEDRYIELVNEFTQGAITVADEGCVYYALLIVSGPGRGRIANISLDQREKVYFADNPDFLSWYERWLDELLAEFQWGWFGFGATGTEEELAGRLRNPLVDAHDKKEAIHTLQRMKVLSVSTLESLLVCSQSKDDDLRAAAYYALEAHRKSGTP
jgi:hypothetical protein